MQDHTQKTGSSMTIRRLDLTESDRVAIDRLAKLDSRKALDGPVLGVEIEGSLMAAISLTSGETIADPFSRTAELRAMLELRAAQLRRRAPRSRRGRTRRSRPAVAGGSAGRIITLPRWG